MTRGVTAQAASTPISVGNVGESIHYTSVGTGGIKPQTQGKQGKGMVPQSVSRDLVRQRQRGQNQPNVQGEQLGHQGLVVKEPIPTPVIVERLEELLVWYPQDKFEYIIDGFSKGFRIGFSGDHRPQPCVNLRSAEQHLVETLLRPKFRKRLLKVALRDLLRRSHLKT